MAQKTPKDTEKMDEETFDEETEEERFERILLESGLLEPLGPQWFQGLEDVPEFTHEELWELTKRLSPLSETIIEERGIIDQTQTGYHG